MKHNRLGPKEQASATARSPVREGRPFPLGATWDGLGVNFALFSANATKVELCPFDNDGEREIERIELPEYTDEVWHGYPMHDMIAVLALESSRHRCLVVGEDLGTVPEGFRDRMEAGGILSYRVVFFEKGEDGRFIAPQNYPPLALAVLGSHDSQPCVAGGMGSTSISRLRAASIRMPRRKRTSVHSGRTSVPPS